MTRRPQLRALAQQSTFFDVSAVTQRIFFFEKKKTSFLS